MTLADEDTSVMDRLGESELVDASLQTTLQEILDLEGQHVIELHAGLVEHTNTNETANEGIAFEETLRADNCKRMTVGLDSAQTHSFSSRVSS